MDLDKTIALSGIIGISIIWITAFVEAIVSSFKEASKPPIKVRFLKSFFVINKNNFRTEIKRLYQECRNNLDS